MSLQQAPCWALARISGGALEKIGSKRPCKLCIVYGLGYLISDIC